EEEEEEESQGGAFHSRAVSRRGGGWVRLRCAAGRSARGARGPLGAPLRGLACGARGQRAGGHRPAAGRPAWGAIIVRCPSEVGTSRAPVGSCEPGLALAEDGEGEQERQEEKKVEEVEEEHRHSILMRAGALTLQGKCWQCAIEARSSVILLKPPPRRWRVVERPWAKTMAAHGKGSEQHKNQGSLRSSCSGGS
ncbi:unnamed protein product, partial [Prorocentrum cordatum]